MKKLRNITAYFMMVILLLTSSFHTSVFAEEGVNSQIFAMFFWDYDGENLIISTSVQNCAADCLAKFELFNVSKNETTIVYQEIKAGETNPEPLSIPLLNYGETFNVNGSFVSIDKNVVYMLPQGVAFFTPAPDVEIFTENDFQYYINKDSKAVVTQYCGSDSKIIIPDTLGGYDVTELDGWSLCGAEMTELIIGKNLQKIGYGALTYCFMLENITVDSQNQHFKFEDGVLYNSDKTELILYILTNTSTHFDMPDSVTIVGAHAFEATENLKTISVSKNIKRIERQAFGASGLTGELILPEGLEAIGSEALTSCFTKIHIPKSTTLIAMDAFDYSMGLKEITVDEENEKYTAVDGVLYTKDKSILIRYPGDKAGRTFEIPSTVKEIKPFAFGGISNLNKLVIPASIKPLDHSIFGFHDGPMYIHDAVKDGRTIVYFSAATITTVSEDSKTFNVMPINLDFGKTVILALYDDGKFIEMQPATFEGAPITFTTAKAYDEAKVMVWENLSSLSPVCDVEIVE